MKPTRTIETVQVERWTCAHPEHRHRTKAVAAACIAKDARVAAFHAKTLRWDDAAYAAILAKHRAGATYAEIGRELNRTRERIRQAVEKAKRLELRNAARVAPPPLHKGK